MSEIAYKPIGKLPDEIKIPVKYTPSYYEYLQMNSSVQIKKISAGIENGGISMYTVPKDHTFFLTNYVLTGYGTGIGYLLQGASAGTTIVFLKMYCVEVGAVKNMSIPVNLSMPMPIQQNEIIWVESSQIGFTCSGTIIGFLVHNSLLI